MSAFPPIYSYPSIPVSTDVALQRLQEYLSATRTNPYLLPNATLQSDGPRAQSESASNLVIHNLKRVEAGLKGEWLAPSLELEGETDTMDLGIGLGGGVGGNTASEENGEGWQDLDEYQREQSIEDGEVGPRDTAIGQEGDEAMDVDVEALDEINKKALDKEVRRREKKERIAAQKKDRVNKQKK